jgi:hypothetical protein
MDVSRSSPSGHEYGTRLRAFGVLFGIKRSYDIGRLDARALKTGPAIELIHLNAAVAFRGYAILLGDIPKGDRS